MNRTKFSVLVTCLTIVLGSYVQADPLGDFMRSKEYYNLHQDRSQGELLLRPGSNMENFFSRFPKLDLLAEWLKTSSAKYTEGRRHSEPGQELVAVYTSYTDTQTKKVFQVAVLVPHPKMSESIALKIFEPINKFEPPLLKPRSEANPVIGQKETKLYFKQDGSCHLLVKSSFDTAVIVGTNDCQQNQDKIDQGLVDFANTLNFERLDQKLKL